MTVHEPQWTENLLATCYSFPVINSMLSTVKATKIFKIRICEIAFAALLQHSCGTLRSIPEKKRGGGGEAKEPLSPWARRRQKIWQLNLISMCQFNSLICPCLNPQEIFNKKIF